MIEQEDDMHRSMRFFVMVMTALVMAAGVAGAGVAPGEKAPGFTLKDHQGREVSLTELAGKVVVLEWVNPECPFVKRHDEQGTMKTLAAAYADRGVVWLTVNSTHFMDQAANAAYVEKQGRKTPVLVDAEGTVGKLYGAQTTPHMFVIDQKGIVVYAGAIDDDPRGGKGEAAVNHVAVALDSLLAGKSVEVAETKPYGCSVKYKS
jgi:peroxiredoxin